MRKNAATGEEGRGGPARKKVILASKEAEEDKSSFGLGYRSRMPVGLGYRSSTIGLGNRYISRGGAAQLRGASFCTESLRAGC